MISSNRNRNIPIIVRVSGELKYLYAMYYRGFIEHFFSSCSYLQPDVNDNAPVFVNAPYEVTVPEVSDLFLY